MAKGPETVGPVTDDRIQFTIIAYWDHAPIRRILRGHVREKPAGEQFEALAAQPANAADPG